MRIFLSILILVFNLQSWAKADDIRDFEIEGISIGDNLLDHFSKEEIDLFYKSLGPAHNAIEIEAIDKNQSNYYPLTKYEVLQISYVIDKTTFFKVTAISGGIYYDNDIKTCFKKKMKLNPILKIF